MHGLETATMRGTLGAFIQSCLILLVRADQWRLKDSASCELNRKVSCMKRECMSDHTVSVCNSVAFSVFSFAFNFALFCITDKIVDLRLDLSWI